MAQIHGIQARAGAITCRQGHHLLAELPHSERYRGNMPADQGTGSSNTQHKLHRKAPAGASA